MNAVCKLLFTIPHERPESHEFEYDPFTGQLGTLYSRHANGYTPTGYSYSNPYFLLAIRSVMPFKGVSRSQ